MKVEMWTLDRVKPYDKNPRLNDNAVDAVVNSIEQFGFRQPIVVDSDGIIIVGHTRFKAAQKMGLTKVPIHIAKDLSADAIKAYRIADNKTGELAEWDFDLLPTTATPVNVEYRERNLRCVFCQLALSQ